MKYTSSLTNNKTPHLLLVEDNAIALKIIEIMIREAGYTFSSAEDGEKALALVKSTNFDLIITDLGLPGLTGFELSQHIRNWETNQNTHPIPILGLTGHAQELVRQECLKHGMNEVYTKPITQALLQHIASYLSHLNI